MKFNSSIESNLAINNELDFSYDVALVSHPDPFISSTPSLSTPIFWLGAGAIPGFKDLFRRIIFRELYSGKYGQSSLNVRRKCKMSFSKPKRKDRFRFCF